ncbi:hypothetical protein [Pararhizobium gei]|uniref:hypothetical protein n=1 Tax=Pararhizobium gei TaxID=1395951 RepID=UPI0023DC0B49|nr:hypothetical protein [Rhizobium gei]
MLKRKGRKEISDDDTALILMGQMVVGRNAPPVSVREAARLARDQLGVMGQSSAATEDRLRRKFTRRRADILKMVSVKKVPIKSQAQANDSRYGFVLNEDRSMLMSLPTAVPPPGLSKLEDFPNYAAEHAKLKKIGRDMTATKDELTSLKRQIFERAQAEADALTNAKTAYLDRGERAQYRNLEQLRDDLDFSLDVMNAAYFDQAQRVKAAKAEAETAIRAEYKNVFEPLHVAALAEVFKIAKQLKEAVTRAEQLRPPQDPRVLVHMPALDVILLTLNQGQLDTFGKVAADNWKVGKWTGE